MTSDEPLISDIAVYIFNTFKVSVQQANERATGIKALISARGGEPDNFSSLELKELVTRHLKDTYEWKDTSTRNKWEAKQKKKVESYNQFISSKRTRYIK